MHLYPCCMMPTDSPSVGLISERANTFTCLILRQSIGGKKEQPPQGEKPILSRCHSLDPFSRPWSFMKRNTVHSDFKSKKTKNGEGNIQGQYFLEWQESKDGFCCKYSAAASRKYIQRDIFCNRDQLHPCRCPCWKSPRVSCQE